MKRLVVGLFAAAMSVGIGLGSASAIEIRLGDWQSTTHIVSVEGTQYWMNKVEDATNGAITFEHYPAEQAAKSRELLDAVKNGILDAALIGPIYSSDVLPLNSVVALPGYFSSAAQGTKALQSMLADGPLKDEMTDAGVVPIFAFVLPPYQLLSKNGRIGGPDDWKGLKIRTSGATQAMVARGLGASGVSVAGPEVYTGVERGLLDAVLFPIPSVAGYKLQEVVDAISTNGAFGSFSFTIVMRKDLYEGLSQDDKDALAAAGADAAANVAKAQDDSVGELTAQWAADGIVIYQFTDEESAAINAAISGATDEWIERIGAHNPKAAEVVARFKELNAQ